MKDKLQQTDSKAVKIDRLKMEETDPEDALRAFMKVDPEKVKRQERIERAIREVLEKIGESDPPVDQLFRDLAQEHDITEGEIREAWKSTSMGRGP